MFMVIIDDTKTGVTKVAECNQLAAESMVLKALTEEDVPKKNIYVFDMRSALPFDVQTVQNTFVRLHMR